MVYITATSPKTLFPAKQDEHTKAFRWYWFTRGIEIKTNGQVFNARGVPQYGKSYEQAAREYGR